MCSTFVIVSSSMTSRELSVCSSELALTALSFAHRTFAGTSVAHMHSHDPYQDASHTTIGSGADEVRICHALFPRSESATKAAPLRFLLIHGNPSHLDHWTALLPGLQKLGDVLLYDQPGFGRSGDWRDGKYPLERYADLAIALLDKMDWREPVVLVGQSHGGLVASMAAARAPSRVSGLVLLGTAGTPAHNAYRALALPHADTALEWLAHRLFSSRSRQGLARNVVRQSMRQSFTPDPTPVEAVESELLFFTQRPEIAGRMAGVTQDNPCQKVATAVSQLRAPVLFVHGKDDALVPIAYAERLHALVQKHTAAKFVVVPGGHMVHHTHPERVIEPLTSWLGSRSTTL